MYVPVRVAILYEDQQQIPVHFLQSYTIQQFIKKNNHKSITVWFSVNC